MTSFFLAFEAFEHDKSEFLTKICENGKLKFAGCWVDAHCVVLFTTAQMCLAGVWCKVAQL